MKMVAMMVSTFMTWFMRLDDRRKIDVEHAGKHFAVGFDGIDDLNGMVVDVAQVYLGGWADQLRIALFQPGDHFAQRPDRLAQVNHFPLQIMDLAQGFGPGID